MRFAMGSLQRVSSGFSTGALPARTTWPRPADGNELAHLTFPGERHSRRWLQFAVPRPKSPTAIRAAAPTPDRPHRITSIGAARPAVKLPPTPVGPSPHRDGSAIAQDPPRSHREMRRLCADAARPFPECWPPQASTAREPKPHCRSQDRRLDGLAGWIRRCRPKPTWLNCRERGSWSVCVPIGFELLPIEGASLHLSGTHPDTLGSRPRLAMIDAPGIGNQPGHGAAMPGDDDFLSALHPVQQGAKGVFSRKSPDLEHVCALYKTSLS